MESIMARQREKVGQEAFLRAVGVKNAVAASTPTNNFESASTNHTVLITLTISYS
jgi:hypothetical protein